MKVESTKINGIRVVVLSEGDKMVPFTLSTFRQLNGWQIYMIMMKQLGGRDNEKTGD